MNTHERLLFWDAFLKADNDVSNVNWDEYIKYPKCLYRYRKVEPMTLSALMENKLYLGSPKYYDDPFDTQVYVDCDRLKEEMTSYLDSDNYVETILEEAKRINLDLPKECIPQNKEELSDLIDVLIEEIRREIKDEAYSACFSETPLNETLWLKYAENHRGFVVVYDIIEENFDEFTAHKEVKGLNKPYYMSLYPVVYSDKHYDVTEFIKGYTILKIFERMGLDNDLMKKLIKKFNNRYLYLVERIGLVKRKCHEYDMEWRTIAKVKNPKNVPVYCNWKPKAVVLGLKIEMYNRNLVVNLAKVAGITDIYETYIDQSGNLNLRLIENEEESK